jgi:predicted phage terminase large subunit-like protein
VTAFRGSGKSTIMTLSYPIWAVVGSPQKKFILILTKTQTQAKIHFANLKRELESNDLLRSDLGPFEIQGDEWGQYSIVLSKYGARITAASSEQSIRGIRHGSHRPDLVIVDDPDDLQSVKTLEGRDKTWQWLTGEVMPIGDRDTKIVVIGNLLHEDSVMMRLRDGIEKGVLNGTYREYPLLDAESKIAWPGKYENMAAIEELKKTIGSESSFQREYLLRIMTSDDQVVQPDWIQYYDAAPPEDDDAFRYAVTGIDLAISEKESADYTAMVSARVYGYREKLRVCILPNPVNERLDFPRTVDRAIALSKTLGGGTPTKLIIEEVGYQKSLIDHLKDLNIPAIGLRPQGQDKRERLSLVSHLIQQGRVLFPRHGNEMLITQLLGFGKERHDDLVDALVIVLLSVLGDTGSSITIPSGPWDRPKDGPMTQKDWEREADRQAIEEGERKRGYYRNGPHGRAGGFTY